MHFYQKNIPDFNNATRHLTRVERSLFSDAIEVYYDTEKPLTKDIKKLERLLLAQSDEEKCALQTVLDDFFTLTDDGYFNKRCNEEILKYQLFIGGKSKAGKASAEQRAKQKATDVEQRSNIRSTHEQLNNTQYPIPNNQEPECENGNSEESEKTHTQITVGLIAEGLQQIGMMPFNPQLPKFITLLEAGATVEEFISTALEKKGTDKFNFSYLLTTMTNRRLEAARAKPLHKGAMPATTSREQGRAIAASSIFTPENTQHLQGNQLKTIEVKHEQRAITA